MALTMSAIPIVVMHNWPCRGIIMFYIAFKADALNFISVFVQFYVTDCKHLRPR